MTAGSGEMTPGARRYLAPRCQQFDGLADQRINTAIAGSILQSGSGSRRGGDRPCTRECLTDALLEREGHRQGVVATRHRSALAAEDRSCEDGHVKPGSLSNGSGVTVSDGRSCDDPSSWAGQTRCRVRTPVGHARTPLGCGRPCIPPPGERRRALRLPCGPRATSGSRTAEPRRCPLPSPARQP